MGSIKPFRIAGFKGMNNLPRSPASQVDQNGHSTPTFILNADVTDGFSLKKRLGQKKVIPLAGAHSLWGGSVMLVADPGALYYVQGAKLVKVADLAGPPEPFTYFEANGLIYFSNRWNNGVFDLWKMQVRSWGIALPPAPQVSLTDDGSLVPGKYTLTFTNTRDRDLSGNGPLVQVSWEGAPRGIKVHNLPPGALCWITPIDGGEFLLAPLDADGVIRRQSPQVQPLPTLLEKPPPPFAHFSYGFGRIWGAHEDRVIYSQPYRLEGFIHYFPFHEDVVMIAPVSDGLFVNSRTSTWYLDSGDPQKAVARRVGDGAIPGTLTYAMRKSPDRMGSPHPVALPEPVWVSPRGVIAGDNQGRLLHLTDTRLKMDYLSAGAGLYRVVNGWPQLIFSLFGSPREAVDATLSEIINRGNLFP